MKTALTRKWFWHMSTRRVTYSLGDEARSSSKAEVKGTGPEIRESRF